MVSHPCGCGVSADAPSLWLCQPTHQHSHPCGCAILAAPLGLSAGGVCPGPSLHVLPMLSQDLLSRDTVEQLLQSQRDWEQSKLGRLCHPPGTLGEGPSPQEVLVAPLVAAARPGERGETVHYPPSALSPLVHLLSLVPSHGLPTHFVPLLPMFPMLFPPWAGPMSPVPSVPMQTPPRLVCPPRAGASLLRPALQPPCPAVPTCVPPSLRCGVQPSWPPWPPSSWRAAWGCSARTRHCAPTSSRLPWARPGG